MERNGVKVPVLYYLCRNQQMEHPHFIEVGLVSPEGLYLRDVIEKMNSVRGRGMASMYSWSCKRSYRNAFVWNDLSEDDLIVPVNGNEYILKGSELVLENSSGRFAPARNIKSENSNQSVDQSNASTQTEQQTCTTNLLIANRSVQPSANDTLQSLMQSEDSNFTNTLNNKEEEQQQEQEEENQVPTNAKIRASNLLLQLISCGSVSSQGSDSRLRSLDSKASSRRFSTSVTLGDLDFLSDRFKGVKLEDKQYFSGSLVETKLGKNDEISKLKRSSSYSANRINNYDLTMSSAKSIPRSIMGSLRSTSVRFCEDCNSCIMSPCKSNNDNVTTEACLANKPSKEMESYGDNKENVIKIEESSLQELELSFQLEATECPAMN